MADAFEFDINGFNFKADRLGAIDQFQLSRKLAPLIPPLAPLVMKIARAVEDKSSPLSTNVLELVELAEPFADALAALKDDVAAQLLTMTLSTVKVETAPGTWMPLWIPGAKMTMVAELNDFGKLLPIMIRVIQLNLGPFISGFLTSHEEPAAKESSGVPSRVRKTGS